MCRSQLHHDHSQRGRTRTGSTCTRNTCATDDTSRWSVLAESNCLLSGPSGAHDHVRLGRLRGDDFPWKNRQFAAEAGFEPATGFRQPVNSRPSATTRVLRNCTRGPRWAARRIVDMRRPPATSGPSRASRFSKSAAPSRTPRFGLVESDHRRRAQKPPFDHRSPSTVAIVGPERFELSLHRVKAECAHHNTSSPSSVARFLFSFHNILRGARPS